MKKLILILTMIISSARAEEGMYFKLAAGLNHINKTYHRDSLYNGDLKLKRYFPVLGLGAGYEFNNHFRIETMVDYYFLFSQMERTKMGNMNFNLNLDTKISDWVINLYKGFPINERLVFFLGTGIGVSSIQDEGTGYVNYNGIDKVLAPTYGQHVYRLTHRFSTGIEYLLHKNIYGEFSYNYLMLGHNKPKKIEGVDNILKREFKVHNLTLGLRFML